MNDSEFIRSGLEGQQVTLDSRSALKRWCDRFGCSEAELLAAVAAGGISTNAMLKYLSNRTLSQSSRIYPVTRGNAWWI
ncbi:DUF3606 domain-containing protein [Variovorax sp. RB2P76]|uniref:DUF3606 domain-containing protein n=1 Tax=unclassified Variovorax TaxID=663243 RepID=UPI003F463014